LFHAAVISLVISLFSPVEFQVYEKVADVIIASPGRIWIPSTTQLASQREGVSNEVVARADQSRSAATETRSTIEGESEIPSRRTIRRGRMPQDKIATPPPELTAKFRLDAPQSEKPVFTLNINPAEGEETEREMTMDELDLLGYLRSDPAQTRPLRGDPSRTIRAGISSRGQPGVGNVIEYDITPWADGAVARIQRNWIIPPSQGKEEKKAVEISVVVAKSGELLSFEIRNSSGTPHLDMAALNAINLSAPLPALPGDFPLDRLEAHLVFQYYE
jgi:TonB family protein